jgi:hypothetical protein
MAGNEEKYEPCEKCRRKKSKCTHGTWKPKVSQETACAECRRLKIKCHHKGAAAGAAAVPKPARTMSYADVVRAAPRGLTGPEREAAEAFCAPGTVACAPVRYEVVYFDAKNVPGYNPDLR